MSLTTAVSQTVAASRIQNRWRAAKKKADESQKEGTTRRGVVAADPITFTLDDSIAEEHQPFDLSDAGQVATVLRGSTDGSYQYIRTVTVLEQFKVSSTSILGPSGAP